MFLALTSISASPGVSTTALALALNSPTARTLLVEADPTGSSPTLAGYLRGALHHDWSLINLVDAHRHDRLATQLPTQLVALPDTTVEVLPGLVHASQAEAMRPLWNPLAVHLAGIAVEGDTNVIVDAGRVGHRASPHDLVAAAATIAILTRTTLTAIAALRANITSFRRTLAAEQSAASLGLILIGNHYSAADVSKVTGLDVITTLPASPDARVFEGMPMGTWRRRRSLYLRALHTAAWPAITNFAATHQPDPRTAPDLATPMPSFTGARP